MEKINAILNHPDYISYLNRIASHEVNRPFCTHTIEHMLSVARIGYIEILEQHLPIAKEVIYAAALLHDVGRWMEYEQKVPHHKASVLLSKDILIAAGFPSQTITAILEAIATHRKDANGQNSIQGILYRADKKSRNCFYCQAIQDCHWSDSKKNLFLEQ